VPLAFQSWESRRCIDRDRDRADLQTRSRPATARRLVVCRVIWPQGRRLASRYICFRIEPEVRSCSPEVSLFG
jgi:hypothetical protein